jgi:hypothetical protein
MEETKCQSVMVVLQPKIKQGHCFINTRVQN